MFEIQEKKADYELLISKYSGDEEACCVGVKSIETPLGFMIAIGDDEVLHLLEFVDRRHLERQVERFCSKMHFSIVPGSTKSLRSIEKELRAYFRGECLELQTPIQLHGSPFQVSVWEELFKIPVGKTRSYADIARAIEKPTAYRAVAGANGANQLALIIPCHRVINTGGELGGYAGGLSRKQWLLDHERQYA